MAKQLNSAYFATPPLTENDFYIAKWLKLPVVKNMTSFVHNASYVVYQKDVSGPSRGPSFLAGLAVALVLVVTVTSTRLGIRIRTALVSYDDYVLIPGLLSVICYYALFMNAIAGYGMGKKSVNVTYMQIAGMIDMTNITALFAYTAIFSASLSMTLLCRRLVDLAYTKLRIALLAYAVLIVMIWLSVILLISLFYGAKPAYFDFAWLAKNVSAPPPGKAIATRYCLMVHFTVDAILFLIPILVILQSQIRKVVKFQLCFVFALGVVHLTAAYMTTRAAASTKDIAWDALRNLALWNVIDVTSAMIVVSLPMLNGLFPKCGPRSNHSTSVWLGSRNGVPLGTTSPKGRLPRDSEESYIGMGLEHNKEGRSKFTLDSVAEESAPAVVPVGESQKRGSTNV
ncbi:MAG: hypothetical protein M1814_003141 [Vezdaea aestivalis]|nr:MAG: hypothetical protein M1814_003141 [Vezdaea aestivalis]